MRGGELSVFFYFSSGFNRRRSTESKGFKTAELPHEFGNDAQYPRSYLLLMVLLATVLANTVFFQAPRRGGSRGSNELPSDPKHR